MSDKDIICLDSDDDQTGGNSTDPKQIQVFNISSDESPNDDIQVDKEVYNGDIQYMGRTYKPRLSRRRRRRDRNKNQDSNNVIQRTETVDPNQSPINTEVTINQLKNELLTPPKNLINPGLNTSPEFEPTNQNSCQSSSQSLPQISDENSFESSSQVSNHITSETSINCVITSTTASPEQSCDPSKTNQSISPIVEPTDVAEQELTDFGIEDTENEMDCDLSMNESALLSSPTPMDLSSTRMTTSDIVVEVVQTLENNNSSQRSPLKEQTTNESLQINETLTNLSIVPQTNDPTSQSLDDNKSENITKEIAVDTQDLIFKTSLTFDDSDVGLPQQQNYFICSFDECEEEFNNALLHYKHEKKHLNELKRKNIRTFKCIKKGCDFIGLTQVELMFHNSEHRGVFLCQDSNCCFRGQNGTAVSEHMNLHRTGKKRIRRQNGVYCDCGEDCCRYPQRLT